MKHTHTEMYDCLIACIQCLTVKLLTRARIELLKTSKGFTFSSFSFFLKENQKSKIFFNWWWDLVTEIILLVTCSVHCSHKHWYIFKYIDTNGTKKTQWYTLYRATHTEKRMCVYDFNIEREKLYVICYFEECRNTLLYLDTLEIVWI